MIGARQKEEQLLIDSLNFNCFDEERFQQIDSEILKMLEEQHSNKYESIGTH